MKKLLLLAFIASLSMGGAVAQSPRPTNQTGAQLTPASVSLSTTNANQAVISSLANLPDADMLVYINPQRILNEVVPKVMPAKDVEEMRKDFEEVKKNFNVDPTKVEYIVLAIRFKKPTGDLKFQPPEALVVTGGDFSAESLIGLARMATQGQMRDETYGGKTLGLMKIDPIAKEAEKNPFLRGFSEVGVVALTGSSLAAGTPAYLRSAIDAADGKGRISMDTLNSLVRDSNALISIAGRPLQSFAKSFGLLGTETTERANPCETKMGDFYAAVTMDATNFIVRGAINEDNPDTAKIVTNLLSGLLGYASSSIPDPSAQAMLKNIVLAAEGDDVTVRADLNQQMVIDTIKKQMAPKKDEAAASEAPKTPAKARPRRRTKRRT
ncbi:MAG TPA: hypothetical protein VJU86_07985 [Pyrinomonadaceae bacterium]|nr:hypothetical protein [Pyrinomonadaceae bacterium]